MLIVCSWYHEKKIIGEEPGPGEKHRFCPECKERFQRESDEYIRTLFSRPIAAASSCTPSGAVRLHQR